MKNYMIVLIDTIDKVKKFVNIVQKNDKDVTVKSGNYIVNGKSIMGLFSLDVSTPVEVFFSDGIEDDVRDELAIFQVI